MTCVNCWIKRLSVALGLQVLVVLLVWWPASSETAKQAPLLSKIDWAALNKFTVSGDKQTVTLHKVGEGWQVSELMDFSASSKKISEVFEKLKALKPSLVVAKNAASQKRLQVSSDNYVRQLTLGEDGKVGLFVGSAPQFRHVHVRALDNENVYVTDKISAIDLPTRAEDWIERDLVPATTEEVVKIDIKRGKESLVFERREVPSPPAKEGENPVPPHSEWFLGKDAVNPSKFVGMLRNLADMSLSRVLGRDEVSTYGLKNPQATITLTFKVAADPVVITVGDKKDADYHVKLNNSPFYFLVSEYQLNAVLKNSAKDWVAKSS